MVSVSYKKGTSSLFYGANTGLSQSKTLSSAINKCSTANDQVKTDICKVVKTTLKFDNQKYIDASNVLTDIEYSFQAMSGFYYNFLNCLNDQNQTTTGVTTVRNLDILLYQLDIYVITGVQSKFAAAADVLGVVFGDKAKEVINQISVQFSLEFNIVKNSISELRNSFQSIVESGNEITIESINATLSDTAFNDMITAFKDIEVTTKQCSTVVSNFVSVTVTLEKITALISTSQSSATSMITKGFYNLDVAVQASKKMFANRTLILQNDVEESFSEFQLIGAQQFSGDEEVYAIRSLAENFVIEIKSIFDQSSNEFQIFFTETFTEMSKDISSLKEQVSSHSKEVTDFVADSVSENSGSFSKCFETSSSSKEATLLIEALGKSSSLCIAEQTNSSLQAQGLLSFVTEDTVLSVKTQSDRLCACAVKGDKKTEEKSKRCFKRVRNKKLLNFYKFLQPFFVTERRRAAKYSIRRKRLHNYRT